MATSCLHLSMIEFDEIEPKTLFAMISEYREIQNYQAMLYALAANGHELPKVDKPYIIKKKVEPFYVHSFFF